MECCNIRLLSPVIIQREEEEGDVEWEDEGEPSERRKEQVTFVV